MYPSKPVTPPQRTVHTTRRWRAGVRFHPILLPARSCVPNGASPVRLRKNPLSGEPDKGEVASTTKFQIGVAERPENRRLTGRFTDMIRTPAMVSLTAQSARMLLNTLQKSRSVLLG